MLGHNLLLLLITVTVLLDIGLSLKCYTGAFDITQTTNCTAPEGKSPACLKKTVVALGAIGANGYSCDTVDSSNKPKEGCTHDGDKALPEGLEDVSNYPNCHFIPVLVDYVPVESGIEKCYCYTDLCKHEDSSTSQAVNILLPNLAAIGMMTWSLLCWIWICF